VADLDRFLRVIPEGSSLSEGLRQAVASTRFCRETACVLIMVDPGRAIVAGHWRGEEAVQSQMLARDPSGGWNPNFDTTAVAAPAPTAETDTAGKSAAAKTDLRRATVELRAVERRQLFIDGKPLGAAFE